ncbi:MAG: hypothetical protein AAF703_07450 [Cyanobacteria bacterium P01_D01_bin.105]
MFLITKLHTALFGIGGICLLVMPAIANDLSPTVVSSAPDASVLTHIEDYSPVECTGQVSYTVDASEIQERLASLAQDFDDTVASILSAVSLTDCAAVTGTLSDTTQNINYLHETKGVYKVVTSAVPTIENTEDYLYTFDVLGVRYIPYDSDRENTGLDMPNSRMLRAIGGTCVTDDVQYPYEADCTFAVTDAANSELSIGKLYYYF